MYKYVFSIGLIVLGMVFGQLLRHLVQTDVISNKRLVGTLLRIVQRGVLLVVNPIVTLGAFWGASFSDIRYAVLPVLGVLAIGIGGILGFAASRILKHDKRQAGAMFCSSSFTNLGSFGTLICFLFFGEGSYVLVSLYRLFEQISYFLVGFPIAKRMGVDSEQKGKKGSLLRTFTDPYILVYLSCISIGVLLNVSGLPRPAFYPEMNNLLIPTASLLLTITVGFNMKFSAIKGYLRECVSISAVKFLIVPVIITSLAYLAGFGTIENGLALRVVFVLSAMPPAFSALIPPQLYHLDTDLANSTWLFNSGVFILVVPVLYFIQGML